MKLLLTLMGQFKEMPLGMEGCLETYRSPLLCIEGKEGSVSVLEHELRVIVAGLATMKDLNIMKVAMASNSQPVVNIVSKKQS